MGARLRVFLKEEEERTLKEMRQAENLGKRERDRAAAICLSHHGWYVEKIAAYLRIGIETVRRTLNKWKKEGLGGIYEKKGRGRSKKWQEEDMQYLEWKLRNGSCANKVWGKGQNRPKSRDERLNEHVEQQYCEYGYESKSS